MTLQDKTLPKAQASSSVLLCLQIFPFHLFLFLGLSFLAALHNADAKKKLMLLARQCAMYSQEESLTQFETQFKSYYFCKRLV